MRRFLLSLLIVALAAMPLNALASSTVYPMSSPKSKPRLTNKPSDGVNMTAMAAEVVRQTNMERAKRGLSQLSVDSCLSAGACVRAKEIVNYFSHTRPNGKRGVTACAKAVGENIAKGQQTADKVMAAWMSSSGHRATILRPSLKTIGVCAYRVNGIMYWVQLFGA